MATRSETDSTNKTDVKVNPFDFHLEVPWYKYPQILIMSVTVAPLRLFTLFLLVVVAWVMACVVLLGIDKEEFQKEPLRGWRRRVREVYRYMGRFGVCVTGFSVETKGKQVDARDAAAVVCAPHSSFFDSMFIFLSAHCPTVIAKTDTANYPFFGALLMSTQPVLVPRGDKNANQKIIEEMKRRFSSNGKWNQQLLFPEATCTNRKALIPFKLGAFIPGMPVQPVTIEYHDHWDTATWTWLGGAQGWMLAWLTLCKIRSRMTLNFLPVYVPSEEEKDDPVLYATNVREVMAKSLKVPCSHLTMDDAKEMYKKELKESKTSTVHTKSNPFTIVLVLFFVTSFAMLLYCWL